MLTHTRARLFIHAIFIYLFLLHHSHTYSFMLVMRRRPVFIVVGEIEILR